MLNNASSEMGIDIDILDITSLFLVNRGHFGYVLVVTTSNSQSSNKRVLTVPNLLKHNYKFLRQFYFRSFSLLLAPTSYLWVPKDGSYTISEEENCKFCNHI